MPAPRAADMSFSLVAFGMREIVSRPHGVDESANHDTVQLERSGSTQNKARRRNSKCPTTLLFAIMGATLAIITRRRQYVAIR